ncbi:permease-like cell division protein FtsX [Nonomuraea endophytica]|uniref:permease-like cell division protein FtsX n=1 Tax=Nonomuraea endophytica TaxID=714136 RepID=UPI0037CA47D1
MSAVLTAVLVTGGAAAADVSVTRRGEAAARTDDPGGMNSRTGAVERAVAPLPPPQGPWPTSGSLMVMLCSKDSGFRQCHGHATDGQKRNLEQVLKQLPGVSGVRFVDQEESLREHREAFGHNKSSVRASDMPESFEAELKVMNVKHVTRLEKVPGVAAVYTWGTNFWLGKAHAQVRLCAPRNSPGACEDRGQATDRERDAVFEVLRNIEGVRKIYLEPREHAIRSWRQVLVDTTLKRKTIELLIGENFHLVLDDPADLAPISAAVKGLAGADEVSRHVCGAAACHP